MMNPNDQAVEQPKLKEFEPPSHEYLQSLQRYSVVLKSGRVELLIESSDLVEVLQHAKSLGYKEGPIGQIRYLGFSHDDGIIRIKSNDLNHEVGIVSHGDKDHVKYLLLKGIGRVRF